MAILAMSDLTAFFASFFSFFKQATNATTPLTSSTSTFFTVAPVTFFEAHALAAANYYFDKYLKLKYGWHHPFTSHDINYMTEYDSSSLFSSIFCCFLSFSFSDCMHTKIFFLQYHLINLLLQGLWYLPA